VLRFTRTEILHQCEGESPEEKKDSVLREYIVWKGQPTQRRESFERMLRPREEVPASGLGKELSAQKSLRFEMSGASCEEKCQVSGLRGQHDPSLQETLRTLPPGRDGELNQIPKNQLHDRMRQ